MRKHLTTYFRYNGQNLEYLEGVHYPPLNSIVDIRNETFKVVDYHTKMDNGNTEVFVIMEIYSVEF